MNASVAEFEARRISERTKEALAEVKARGVRLGGYGEGAAQRASERKQEAIAKCQGLRGVLEAMVRAGSSCRAMADALARVGKLSRTGLSLVPAPIGRILQRLGLTGKLLGSDQVGLLPDGSTTQR